MTAGDRLTLIAGGRYDSFSARTENVRFTDERFSTSGGMTSSSSRINEFADVDDGAGTFSLGLLYALSGHYHLTANAGSGFRAPDLFELYSVRGGGSQILLGNPDLNPEYAYNFDIGVKFRHPWLKGGLNLFYNRVDDYIDTERQAQSFLSGIPTYRYVNVRNAELYGAEGEAQFFVLRNCSVFAGFSSVEGKNREDNSNLHNIPPLNGTLGVRWEEDYGTLFRWWVELSGVFYDKNRNLGADEEPEPGYGVANLRGGVKFPKVRMLRDLSLSCSVENLFDRYYFTHQRLEDSWYAPESGLNVVTALQFSF
jgi:hemoglobin/transferrin/lactoferrin receptor protein